jgi:hypothetical protein
MATIFKLKSFEPRNTTTTADKPARTGVSACEIIFFPGVRYERWEPIDSPVLATPAETPKPAPKARAKKRKLEMAD